MSGLTNLLWRVALLPSLAPLACAAPQKAASAEADLIAYDGEVESQSLHRAVLVFPWELQNPTVQKAGVGSVEWTFALAGGTPQKGNEVLDTEAPAAGTATGNLRIEVGTSTSEEAFAARADEVALKYSLVAEFAVNSERGNETIEAEWYGEIFPPRKPEVTIKAEAGRYGDRNFELNFEISIANPNPFPVVLNGLDYVLKVKDVEISRDILARGQRIDPSSAILFEVQRFIGRDDLADLAKSLRGVDAIPYQLDGKLQVGDITVATPVTGEITFSH